jgi:hypothetical protein
METYCKDAKEESLNLITHIEVEPAHESDANALIPAIESSKERGLAPEELLADTLYGGDENCQKAANRGVEVVSPAKSTKEKDGITLSNFEVSEKGDVFSCPQGHVPVRTKTKKTRHTVAFDSQHCDTCPFQETCPVKQGKKYHYLRYTDKEMRLAIRRAYEQTDEFKNCQWLTFRFVNPCDFLPYHLTLLTILTFGKTDKSSDPRQCRMSFRMTKTQMPLILPIHASDS